MKKKKMEEMIQCQQRLIETMEEHAKPWEQVNVLLEDMELDARERYLDQVEQRNCYVKTRAEYEELLHHMNKNNQKNSMSNWKKRYKKTMKSHEKLKKSMVEMVEEKQKLEQDLHDLYQMVGFLINLQDVSQLDKNTKKLLKEYKQSIASMRNKKSYIFTSFK